MDFHSLHNNVAKTFLPINAACKNYEDAAAKTRKRTSDSSDSQHKVEHSLWCLLSATINALIVIEHIAKYRQNPRGAMPPFGGVAKVAAIKLTYCAVFTGAFYAELPNRLLSSKPNE